MAEQQEQAKERPRPARRRKRTTSTTRPRTPESSVPADGAESKPARASTTEEKPKAGGGDAGARQQSAVETQPPREGTRRPRRRRGRAPSAGEPEEKAESDNGPAPEEEQRNGAATRTRPRKRRRGGGGRPRAEDEAIPSRAAGPQTMLISSGKNRHQIAVMQGRSLVEHYVAHAGDRSLVGNIYMGRVENVLPGMEAAFLDIGEGKNAVLYAGEVGFDEEVEGSRPRIETILKSGQSVLAQVTKDPMGSKGARLTTEVSIAGRFLVLVPDADFLALSRRLPDDERARLKEITSRHRPSGHGIIVRTAAAGAKEDAIKRDIARLTRIWDEVSQKAKKAKPPKLVYSEADLTIRVVRDLFTEDIEKVIVEGNSVFDEIVQYVDDVSPELRAKVELHDGESALFDKHQVNEQLRKALDRKVWLKSGGHIVVDRTEAMTVIDVNTGRFVGKSNLEETVFHANLEAAEEVAKQLRLRDIGGIIVIDFIDMGFERHRSELLRVFKTALSRDKTRTQVYGVSELGLVQMTRKKVSEGLLEAFSEPCDKCEGRGVILHDLG